MSNTSHPCRVCQHPDRAAIDQAVVNGKSNRAIARDFGIGTAKSPDHKAVARHIDQCMGEAYRAAKSAATEASGEALANRMRHLDSVVDEVIERARQGVPVTDEHGPMLDPDGRPIVRYSDSTLLSAVREARRNTELRARLAGAMDEGDDAAVDAARKALETPEARRMVQDLEVFLAQGGTE